MLGVWSNINQNESLDPYHPLYITVLLQKRIYVCAPLLPMIISFKHVIKHPLLSKGSVKESDVVLLCSDRCYCVDFAHSFFCYIDQTRTVQRVSVSCTFA